ncbi:putative ribonuclease H-like domain-containing protein [Tanacetum coccineum]
MYSFNLENIVPSGGLACLIAKATTDESNKWHRRLGHVNFKNLNKLVKGNLVRGLPSKIFQNDHTCVACQKGKQHKASCKAKAVSSISHSLQLLHMDLFGPTSNKDVIEFPWVRGEQEGILVLVDQAHYKTPYELLTSKIPIISYIRPFGCHVTILNTIDHLGKFAGKSDEGFLVGYSLQSKAFRVYNLETKRVEENLHITFLENKPNVAGKGPTWLFDLDYLTDSMNYHPVSSENQANLHAGQQEANQNAGTEEIIDSGDSDKEDESAQDYLEASKFIGSVLRKSEALKEEDEGCARLPMEDLLQGLRYRKYWRFLGVDLPYGKRGYRHDKIEAPIDFVLVPLPAYGQDKYVAEILKKFDFANVKTASTPIETQKPLVKDEEASDVDVHLYRSMIGSLMYLTASRPDIMFAVCACSRFQVTPKSSHLSAVKRIFRYLKGKPKLGLWYPRVSSFDLESYSDSDYAGANLDRKSTTGGCQFLGRRLISWQCKKQTIVATSTTEAEYVAAASCCGQVLWIQNQMLDYGFNFMNTKIYIDNESTICIVKNLVYHSKTKHIAIRHHFIRDAYEKKLIQVLKIHTDDNVADLLTKAFDVSSVNTPVTYIVHFLVGRSSYRQCKVSTAGQSLYRYRDVKEKYRQGYKTITLSTTMAVLDSCPKHNMVAYLKKSEGNAEFHEIIDFLTRSSIHHALTVSLVVSTMFVEQFWMSTKSKIINNVRHITAKVAGKPVSISEASIRSDLLFDDANGIDSLPNQAIFDAIQLMGYEGDLTVLTFNKALFSP